MKRNLYNISVRDGVLKGSYSGNQIDLCPQRLLNPADINHDKQIPLREAVIMQSYVIVKGTKSKLQWKPVQNKPLQMLRS